MSEAITADTTGGTISTSRNAHTSSDGRGHATITVRAGSGATAAAAPIAPPISQLSSTPRPQWLPQNFKTVEAFIASQKEGQATITRLSQELAALKGGAASIPVSTPVTPPVAPAQTTATVADLTSIAAAALTDTSAAPTAATDSTPAASAPLSPAPSIAPVEAVDLKALSAEWAKNGGKLTAKTVARLASVGITETAIAQFVEGQTAFAEKHAASLAAAAGGSDRLPIVLQWASINQTDAAMRYNTALSNEDYQGARIILAGLSAIYTQAAGRDPRLVIGGAEAARVVNEAPYLSQAEMQKDLSDWRYGKDAAFTRAVERKAFGYAALRRAGKAF